MNAATVAAAVAAAEGRCIIANRKDSQMLKSLLKHAQPIHFFCFRIVDRQM
jgi:hypothetical protein